MMRFNRFSRTSLALTTACVAAGLGAVGAAQAQVGDAATDSTGLQDIVVTAQKRSQNLQDVPVAVSAVGSDTLESANISNAADLGRLVPALSVFVTTGAVQPFLRGIGNPGSLLGNESSVAVYLDDVYITRVPPSLLQLNTIDRVEVLKGPQGTLFGRNASGGLLHVVTREPSEQAAVEGSFGYGNFDTLRGNIYATAGLAPGLAIDVSGLFVHQRDGWGRNVANAQEWGKDRTEAVRSKLRWEISPDTTVSVSGDYSHAKNDLLAHSQYRYGVARGYQLPPFELQPTLGFYDIEADAQPRNVQEDWGVSGKIEQRLSFANFSSITAYRKGTSLGDFDSDFSKQPFLLGVLDGFSKQFSQEFQLSSKANSSVDWIVGLFYLNSRAGYLPSRFTGLAIDSFAPVLGLPAGTELVSDTYGETRTKSYSAYGQTTIRVTGTTGITLGARYTKDDLEGVGRSELYELGTTPLPGAVTTGSETFKKFTYKLSIDQKITPDILVYLSQSRGYKAGVFNTLPFSNPAARPEVLDATELGFKSELFDRTIRLNGAVFYYKFEDAQFQQFDGPTVRIINADSARIYGAEFEGEAVLGGGLNLRFGASYLDGKYQRFPNAQSPVVNLNTDPALGPIGGYVDGFAPLDASGNRMVRVPKVTANAGLNYSVETAIGGFKLDINYSYTGRFAWDADNVLEQPAYSLLDAQVKYSFPDSNDRYAIRLWAKNLTGTRYYVAQIQSDGARGSSAMPGAPRTYGIDWMFKF